jgi:small nuclear ribonucleoprotein (snRNP)-like protein
VIDWRFQGTLINFDSTLNIFLDLIKLAAFLRIFLKVFRSGKNYASFASHLKTICASSTKKKLAILSLKVIEAK